MKNKAIIAHLSALITIFIWGITFVSTKVLLEGFKPVEILFFRFVIGLAALYIVYPHKSAEKGYLSYHFKSFFHKPLFIFAGLFGVCFYYLLENIALTYTFASNVGIIVSASPFFTAILARLIIKGEEKLSYNFFIGFILAILGIFLISSNGQGVNFNPVGDLLALFAAICWAIYSILIKKISHFGYSTIYTTRRVFLYGILFMIPALFIFDFKLDLIRFYNPIYLLNILFLGLGASALCFATWNYALKVLGAIKTSVYIYMVPVITVVASILILSERIGLKGSIGIILTLLGLFISKR